jgi:hypothetical protein
MALRYRVTLSETVPDDKVVRRELHVLDAQHVETVLMLGGDEVSVDFLIQESPGNSGSCFLVDVNDVNVPSLPSPSTAFPLDPPTGHPRPTTPAAPVVNFVGVEPLSLRSVVTVKS